MVCKDGGEIVLCCFLPIKRQQPPKNDAKKGRAVYNFAYYFKNKTMIRLSSPQLMLALSGDLMPDADDLRRLQHAAVGGVILFARNFADGAQLRQLTAAIRRAAGRRIVIAADQEGGRVQRFGGDDFLSLPAAATLSAARARDAGLVMAAELIAAGVDLSFAPVLDVAHGNSEIIGNRAFSTDADVVAVRAAAFADGMAAAGMACCGKHFPGHGYARADSHNDLPTDARDFAAIAAADLIPFGKWAERAALMTAHIVYPKCDENAATFSSFWLKKVLRQQLNFGGMVVSDDLTMAGADIGDMSERIRAATTAGCDGVLICEAAAADESLATVAKVESAENPWLALAAKADGRICVGDAEYKTARASLATIQ